MSIEKSTTGDVRLDRFLASCRCQQYCSAFREAEILYDDLSDLVNHPEEITDVISKPAPRRRFIRAVKDLFSPAASAAVVVSPPPQPSDDARSLPPVGALQVPPLDPSPPRVARGLGSTKSPPNPALQQFASTPPPRSLPSPSSSNPVVAAEDSEIAICDIPPKCETARTNWMFLMGPEMNLRSYQAAFDHSRTACFCSRCSESSSSETAVTNGSKHSIPRGFTRFGLGVKGVDRDRGCFKSWVVAFHGTSCETASMIIRSGNELLMPGDRREDGVSLSVPAGHFQDDESWTKHIFLSPSSVYSSNFLYAKRFIVSETGNVHQCIFDVRVKPNHGIDSVYRVSQETVGAGTRQIDPNFSNDELEWRTNRRNVVVITGLLVRVWPGGKATWARGGLHFDGIGQLNDSRTKLHGYGRVVERKSDGEEDVYVGELREGLSHGVGTLTFSDGTRYVGQFRDGVFHGHGALWMTNGQTISGNFQDGNFEGPGILAWAKGNYYEGEFRNMKYHGHGVLSLTDGTHYDGEWNDGKKHGHGVMSFPPVESEDDRRLDLDYARYDGEWRNDEWHGHGVLTWSSNGKIYEGEFRNGKKHGHGVLQDDFKTYDGEYRDDVYHGHGVLVDKLEGYSYDGEFQNGKEHGHGVETSPDDEEKYDGEWIEGKKHGHGVTTWPDGRKYEGEFRDGDRNGHGVYSHPDGRKYDGEWKDGAYSGRGVYTYADGRRFVGEFRESKEHGPGVLSSSEGLPLKQGIWVDGVFQGEEEE